MRKTLSSQKDNLSVFSRDEATLEEGITVGRSVRPSFRWWRFRFSAFQERLMAVYPAFLINRQVIEINPFTNLLS